MTYAHLTMPGYQETPESHATRKRKIDGILGRVDDVVERQNQHVSEMGLKALFQMPTGP